MTDFLKVETFRYDIDGHRPIVWNVSQAIVEAEAGHLVATVEIARDEMEAVRERNEWTPEKLDVVDPSVPGIGAPIKHNGQAFYILIDGTHRCVRALRDGLTFSARLLTDEAARRCILTIPAELEPWEAPAPPLPEAEP